MTNGSTSTPEISNDRPCTALKEWRLKRGYTSIELAKEIHSSAKEIYYLEAGLKKGTPNTWLKLATALRVPVSCIFKGKDPFKQGIL